MMKKRMKYDDEKCENNEKDVEKDEKENDDKLGLS